uniref:Disease resistance response protein 230 n=1 Tax=Pisum sativum TaxID=3888 RepID=Q9FR81_PEA|nr:disease resistance response protein 230 precursor [Pisum sativum]
MEKKSLACLSFLLLVLFIAQEIVVSEANTCENLAGSYKGVCFGGCDRHCRTQEGAISGRCRDDFRCWCTKNC